MPHCDHCLKPVEALNGGEQLFLRRRTKVKKGEANPAPVPITQITAAYLSSHQSSCRLLSKMLSTIIMGPLT